MKSKIMKESNRNSEVYQAEGLAGLAGLLFISSFVKFASPKGKIISYLSLRSIPYVLN